MPPSTPPCANTSITGGMGMDPASRSPVADDGEGAEGAEGAEAAAASDGEKSATDSDKKDGDDKKGADKKPAEEKK